MTQPNQSEPAKDIDVTRTAANQSELRLNICGITTGVLWGKNFDELTPNERSRVNAMAKDIEAYITANYTSNSRLKALLKESEKWNGRMHGRSDCKSCALQQVLAELIKDKL